MQREKHFAQCNQQQYKRYTHTQLTRIVYMYVVYMLHLRIANEPKCTTAQSSGGVRYRTHQSRGSRRVCTRTRAFGISSDFAGAIEALSPHTCCTKRTAAYIRNALNVFGCVSSSVLTRANSRTICVRTCVLRGGIRLHVCVYCACMCLHRRHQSAECFLSTTTTTDDEKRHTHTHRRRA